MQLKRLADMERINTGFPRSKPQGAKSPSEAFELVKDMQPKGALADQISRLVGKAIVDAWWGDLFLCLAFGDDVVRLSIVADSIRCEVRKQTDFSHGPLISQMATSPVEMQFTSGRSRIWDRHEQIASRIGGALGGFVFRGDSVSLMVDDKWHLIIDVAVDLSTSKRFLYWQEDVESGRPGKT